MSTLVHKPPTASSPVPATDFASRYQELAELAGRLIHEIKNHLGTFSLNLQLLREEFQNPTTPRERRALQRIQQLQQECQRLADLSSDFLRFARVGQLQRRPVNLAALIQELAEFVTPSLQQRGIELQTFVPADLPTVWLDHDLFQQALLNLILNAEQAMPHGGLITVQAELLSDSVQLTIIDTGEGMTSEVLAQAFRPFFSTRKGGSGLGLPITRRIVEAHGGTIRIQSEPGRGTRVDILLPTTGEEPTTA